MIKNKVIDECCKVGEKDLIKYNEEVDLRGLICPNCKEELKFKKIVKYEGDLYDKYACKGCIHIIVLDYRGEL